MATPTWIAPTSGYQGNGGQINQFLGVHDSSWIYVGSVTNSETIGDAVYQSTESQYISQQFTTTGTQTSVGSVGLQVSVVNGLALSDAIPPLSVSIYATAAGGSTPTGTALATTEISQSVVYNAPFWLTVPIAVNMLTPSTVYQIVVGLVGNANTYYVWQQSNQVAGASTSPDGVNWTSTSYGMMYQVYNQAASGLGLPSVLYDDQGARITTLTYNASGTLLTGIQENIDNQAGDVISYSRAFNYSNNSLTGLS